MSDLVLYDVRDRVALITVNDPDRRNAVTDAMSAQLHDAVRAAEDDAGVHAVVVTGAGKAFCAGADLSALGAAAREGLERIYAGFMAVGRCTLPTIAAVNGAAVGAGMNLALAADVRIAGPHANFDPRFQKLGIHPGGGATWMLQRAVGPEVARAALLFGMSFDAEAAVRHGMALRVADDPVAAALELAAAMPQVDPQRMAVMGFSHGGWAILDALAYGGAPGHGFNQSGQQALTRIKAAVTYYPYCGYPAHFRLSSQARGDLPLLMLLAGKDSVTDHQQCLDSLDDLKLSAIQLTLYQDADHVFDQPSPMNTYQPEIAADAHAKTLAFLRETLLNTQAAAPQ